MTGFGKYLGYRLKSTAFRTFVIVFICVVFTVIMMVESFEASRQVLLDESLLSYNNHPGIEAITICVCILAFIYPVLENYNLRDRKTLDVYFAFPIQRKTMAVVHYLTGLIQLALSSAVISLAGAVVLLIQPLPFRVYYILPFWLLLLAVNILVYSVMTFLISRGNTAADGVVFMILFPLAVGIFLWMLDDIISAYVEDLNILWEELGYNFWKNS